MNSRLARFWPILTLGIGLGLFLTVPWLISVGGQGNVLECPNETSAANFECVSTEVPCSGIQDETKADECWSSAALSPGSIRLLAALGIFAGALIPASAFILVVRHLRRRAAQ